MNNFEIFVDSAANIPDELIEKNNINVISFTITIDGADVKCYEKGVSFSETAKKFYEGVAAGANTKTSLINSASICDAVTPCLESGKDVIIITLTSSLSGTYAQAKTAAEELKKKFADRKIYAIDSANASMGEGLLALNIAKLRDMGQEIDAAVSWIEENKYKINSYVAVEDLKYLRRGGRVSALASIAGTLLNIKPILYADGNASARLSVFEKVRGRKKALACLLENFKKNVISPEQQTVAITHCNCEEDAKWLADEIRKLGATDIIIEFYDLCTGAHVGPGTVALFFTGIDRRGNAEPEKAKLFRKKAVQNN